MSRIVIPPTAFAGTTRKTKRERVKSPSHESFVRSLPCVVCGGNDVDLAHVSYADARFGKFGRGKGQKEESIWTVPLCREHHDIQHSVGERTFWKGLGIDAARVAAALYIRTQDHEAAEIILRHARDR
jgi:hypothetical protein